MFTIKMCFCGRNIVVVLHTLVYYGQATYEQQWKFDMKKIDRCVF